MSKEYRVEWCQRPHMANVRHVVFVEADNPTDAQALVKDHVERKHGVANFSVFEATETQPLPAGRVKA